MKLKFLTILTVLLTTFGLVSFLPAANAAVEVGALAPNFTGTDTHGVKHTLNDLRGKNVVLEWSNHDCPFVVKHYGSGNMQKIQKEATDNGVIWLTIISSAEGKQGHVTADEANKIMKEKEAHATARILDPAGDIGHLYGAKTTPHMFVIDKEGTLVYAGAIDSDDNFSADSIPGATNYVQAALNSLTAGEPIKVSSSKPYGCSVKY